MKKDFFVLWSLVGLVFNLSSAFVVLAGNEVGDDRGFTSGSAFVYEYATSSSLSLKSTPKETKREKATAEIRVDSVWKGDVAKQETLLKFTVNML